MIQDYHVHALAHGEYAYTYDWLKAFIISAQGQGITELGFCEHDEYVNQIDTMVLFQLRNQFPHMKIRLGLEVDYIPGREEYIRQISKQYDFDYFMGSVHYIDHWGFDNPDFRHLFYGKDIDQVYQSYFSLVNMAVRSGLFDVIGHLDLIKIWGHRPDQHNISYYVKPVLTSIKAAGIAIEINSAGLRKPVKEIYPAPEIIELVVSQNIPVTLGSDAHHPSQLGKGLLPATDMLKKAGCQHLAVFDKRIIKFLSL
ncbi:MAG: histidinol-phosphatase HisJ family protein [Syntrophomonadaceae bacterium]|jgi:histidinol-phosphatase (PHP family)